MKLHRLAIIYLIAEALLVSSWWIALFVVPSFRRPFRTESSPDETLLAFAGPDAVMLIGLSLVAAFGLLRQAYWAHSLLTLHAGAAIYATLYCGSLVLISGGQAWLGAIMMSPLGVVAALLPCIIRRGSDMP